jgi:hypothetical protein
MGEGASSKNHQNVMLKPIFTKLQSILEILSFIFGKYGQFATFFVIFIWVLEFILDLKNPFLKSRYFFEKSAPPG